MYVKKKIFLFLLIGGVTVIQAQKNERFTPPNMTQKTHTFALPELQIDSTFITNLNAVIFEIDDNTSKVTNIKRIYME